MRCGAKRRIEIRCRTRTSWSRGREHGDENEDAERNGQRRGGRRPGAATERPAAMSSRTVW